MPPNLLQTVPFLEVADMARSLAYYRDGRGFSVKHEWAPEGRTRWVWLIRGGAALMLQQFDQPPAPPAGSGVSTYFICEDALAVYGELQERGVEASEPEVGNAMWYIRLTDPDGYRLFFESPTDVAEGTKLS